MNSQKSRSSSKRKGRKFIDSSFSVSSPTINSSVNSVDLSLVMEMAPSLKDLRMQSLNMSSLSKSYSPSTTSLSSPKEKLVFKKPPIKRPQLDFSVSDLQNSLNSSSCVSINKFKTVEGKPRKSIILNDLSIECSSKDDSLEIDPVIMMKNCVKKGITNHVINECEWKTLDQSSNSFTEVLSKLKPLSKRKSLHLTNCLENSENDSVKDNCSASFGICNKDSNNDTLASEPLTDEPCLSVNSQEPVMMKNCVKKGITNHVVNDCEWKTLDRSSNNFTDVLSKLKPLSKRRSLHLTNCLENSENDSVKDNCSAVLTGFGMCNKDSNNDTSASEPLMDEPYLSVNSQEPVMMKNCVKKGISNHVITECEWKTLDQSSNNFADVLSKLKPLSKRRSLHLTNCLENSENDIVKDNCSASFGMCNKDSNNDTSANEPLMDEPCLSVNSQEPVTDENSGQEGKEVDNLAESDKSVDEVRSGSTKQSDSQRGIISFKQTSISEEESNALNFKNSEITLDQSQKTLFNQYDKLLVSCEKLKNYESDKNYDQNKTRSDNNEVQTSCATIDCNIIEANKHESRIIDDKSDNFRNAVSDSMKEHLNIVESENCVNNLIDSTCDESKAEIKNDCNTFPLDQTYTISGQPQGNLSKSENLATNPVSTKMLNVTFNVSNMKGNEEIPDVGLSETDGALNTENAMQHDSSAENAIELNGKHGDPVCLENCVDYSNKLLNTHNICQKPVKPDDCRMSIDKSNTIKSSCESIETEKTVSNYSELTEVADSKSENVQCNNDSDAIIKHNIFKNRRLSKQRLSITSDFESTLSYSNNDIKKLLKNKTGLAKKKSLCLNDFSIETKPDKSVDNSKSINKSTVTADDCHNFQNEDGSVHRDSSSSLRSPEKVIFKCINETAEDKTNKGYSDGKSMPKTDPLDNSSLAKVNVASGKCPDNNGYVTGAVDNVQDDNKTVQSEAIETLDENLRNKNNNFVDCINTEGGNISNVTNFTSTHLIKNLTDTALSTNITESVKSISTTELSDQPVINKDISNISTSEINIFACNKMIPKHSINTAFDLSNSFDVTVFKKKLTIGRKSLHFNNESLEATSEKHFDNTNNDIEHEANKSLVNHQLTEYVAHEVIDEGNLCQQVKEVSNDLDKLHKEYSPTTLECQEKKSILLNTCGSSAVVNSEGELLNRDNEESTNVIAGKCEVINSDSAVNNVNSIDANLSISTNVLNGYKNNLKLNQNELIKENQIHGNNVDQECFTLDANASMSSEISTGNPKCIGNIEKFELTNSSGLKSDLSQPQKSEVKNLEESQMPIIKDSCSVYKDDSSFTSTCLNSFRGKRNIFDVVNKELDLSDNFGKSSLTANGLEHVFKKKIINKKSLDLNELSLEITMENPTGRLLNDCGTEKANYDSVEIVKQKCAPSEQSTPEEKNECSEPIEEFIEVSLSMKEFSHKSYALLSEDTVNLTGQECVEHELSLEKRSLSQCNSLIEVEEIGLNKLDGNELDALKDRDGYEQTINTFADKCKENQEIKLAEVSKQDVLKENNDNSSQIVEKIVVVVPDIEDRNHNSSQTINEIIPKTIFSEVSNEKEILCNVKIDSALIEKPEVICVGAQCDIAINKLEENQQIKLDDPKKDVLKENSSLPVENIEKMVLYKTGDEIRSYTNLDISKETLSKKDSINKENKSVDKECDVLCLDVSDKMQYDGKSNDNYNALNCNSLVEDISLSYSFTEVNSDSQHNPDNCQQRSSKSAANSGSDNIQNIETSKSNASDKGNFKIPERSLRKSQRLKSMTELSLSSKTEKLKEKSTNSNGEDSNFWTLEITEIESNNTRKPSSKSHIHSTPLPSKYLDKMSVPSQLTGTKKVSSSTQVVTNEIASVKKPKKKSVTFAKSSNSISSPLDSCDDSAAPSMDNLADISIIRGKGLCASRKLKPNSSTPNRPCRLINIKKKKLDNVGDNSSRNKSKINVSIQVTRDYISSASSRRLSDFSESSFSKPGDVHEKVSSRQYKSQSTRRSRNLTSNTNAEKEEAVSLYASLDSSIEFPPKKKAKISRSLHSHKNHITDNSPSITNKSKSSLRQERALKTITNMKSRNSKNKSWTDISSTDIDASIEFPKTKRLRLEDLGNNSYLKSVQIDGSTLLRGKNKSSVHQSSLVEDDGLPLGFSISEEEDESSDNICDQLRANHPWLPSYIFNYVESDETLSHGERIKHNSRSNRSEDLINSLKEKKQKKRMMCIKKKLAKPAPWANQQFYKYLFDFFKPLYGIEHRKHSEDFILFLYPYIESVKLLKNKKDYAPLVLAVKEKTKELGLCKNIWDYRSFCGYLPYEFKAKSFDCVDNRFDPVIDVTAPF